MIFYDTREGFLKLDTKVGDREKFLVFEELSGLALYKRIHMPIQAYKKWKKKK